MSDKSYTADELTAHLAQFHCSDHLYRHWTGRLHFTDGVKELADLAGAYWLIDAVASHQPDPLVRQEPFQVWVLSRRVGRQFALEMNDGNTTRGILRQEIEYSDFPLDTIELYLTDGVLMLPGEY